ncbi:MAG: glycosyltransferase N-terminal domain-containing protein [Caulobacter sp.]|nr:glycosyltransferase N-terminal domain-containing protein [Caulobacter sp.]
MALPFSLTLYRGATALLAPAVPAILRGRARRGKEDPGRLGERLGRASRPRPPGPLVWLHGASVGETVSLLPLVERIRRERPATTVLVTSGTTTSADLLARRLPPGALHQYIPVDTPGAAARFLDHWKPDLAVFVESELWPNLLLGAKARGARLALVSARMTEESARGWRRFPRAAKAVLGAFDLLLPQDVRTGIRLKDLGGLVDGYANLKLVGEALPADEAELARLKAAACDRLIVTAASTHPGEDTLIAAAVEATGEYPLLVIVPRHPARGPKLATDLRAHNRIVALRSAGEPLTAETDLYIADTLGELGLFFRLGDVAVMGGSFLPDIGGHNPLEAARLARPVVYGDHYANWIDVYGALGAGGIRCEDQARLTAAIATLLSDAPTRALTAAAAKQAAEQEGGVLDRLWTQLGPLAP